MSPKVEPIAEPITLGEGPFWNAQQQTLYYVDIIGASVHSYNAVTKEHHSVNFGDGNTVSLVVQVEGQNDKFVVAINNDIALVTWNGVSSKPSSVETIKTLEGNEEKTRINDGKVDPAGRLWAGTMGPRKAEGTNEFELEKGSLYMLNKDRTLSKQLEKLGISNGLTWSLDNKKFYFIDSLKFRVDSYDYDIDTGNIANEKTVFCFKENNLNSLPDGMTIDEEGKLWVACYDGGQVLRIDPDTGKLLYTLKMPAQQVTSVAFGGANLDELYVTTAKHFYTKELLEKYPLAGSTFRVTKLGVKGTPSIPVKL